MSAVLRLIQELALFEKEPEAVKITVDDLKRDGFGERSLFEVIVAEVEGEIAGMALYYYCYSTWKGKMLHLEDIVVDEQYRRKSVGKALFDAIMLRAQKNAVKHIRFQVLNWNEQAIKFYEKYNVTFDDGWLTCKVYDHQIEEFKSSN